MTPWEFQGRELINCNCSYGCPCQFNALPTHGHCRAAGIVHIEQGHNCDVNLDGLSMVAIMQWPGPIHEGRCKCQPIIDASATEPQREALLKILSGQDTDPGATMFAVFASTFEHVFEPIFAPITFELDVEKRHGRVRVENVVDIHAEPIRNPVTGQEHRARIDLPHGFEYEIAEIGSGTSSTRGNLAMEIKQTYAQFAQLHMNNHGVIRHRTAA
jgi:hypothetical protein